MAGYHNGAAQFGTRDLTPVRDVDVSDDFWSPRINTTQETSIPDLLEIAEQEGKIENFEVVAGRTDSDISLHNCPDSDIYKIVEAASDTLRHRDDRQLEERLGQIIDAIADAQSEDGYLNTQFMLPFEHPASPDPENDHVEKFGYGPEYQWRSKASEWPTGIGQLYCAGHLLEAAVAHYRATGKRTLLDVAIKKADHIDREFTDEEDVAGVADHPNIGLGLLRLYGVTGEDRYLELAELLVENVDWSRPPDISEETSLPLRYQRDAFGHCVRTMYVYSAATDLVGASGDAELSKALDSLWHSVVDKKMYVHGGIGNGTDAEQHGYEYDLPSDEAYAETCASIGMGMWNRRLNLLTGDSKYVDVLELAAYNSALAGVSLDGLRYFYQNRLATNTPDREQRDAGARRRRYLFCCPSNVPRFLARIGRWQYTKRENDVYANLYIEGNAEIDTPDNTVSVTSETNYPWDGNVQLTIDPEAESEFAVNLRIPGWSRGNPVPGNLYRQAGDELVDDWTVTVNGESVRGPRLSQGYLSVRREWNRGDVIELDLPMPVRRVYSHPAVEANEGKVALMRGPLLYCVEGVDHQEPVTGLSVPEDADFDAEHRDGLLEGVTVLTGEALADGDRRTELTAVPYYAWDNRDEGHMRVWLPEE